MMPHYITSFLRLVVVGLIVLVPVSAPAIEREAFLTALDSITNEELKRYVDFLADDSLEGRETGSRGARATGNFLMQWLEKRGLKPAGDGGGYFHAFQGTGRNVLAWLEGSDPVLKNELVILSAHYDHVGYGNAANSYGPFGHVHNGADDDASGVAGLLEVIEAIQKLPTPKRSIMFAFWDSEEKGLDGSKAWLARPTLSGRRPRLAINLDMIGRLRNKFVEVYGTRTGAGLRELVARSNRDDLDLDFTWVMREDSDHYPPYKAGIPSLMIHTGLHNDYHRPSDDVHLINVDGMRQVSRGVLTLLVNAAETPQLPDFRRTSYSEATGREPNPPAAPLPQPRMGITWRQVEVEGEAVLEVATISPGLPAERAGVKVGDRLLELNGKKYSEDKRVRLAIMAAESAVTMRLVRAGLEEPLTVTLTLQGKPVRIGIAWREDDAEPAVVVVTHVVPTSAAANAGLKIKDRVLEVNGQRFTTPAALGKLLDEATEKVELVIERRGRVFAAELELAE